MESNIFSNTTDIEIPDNITLEKAVEILTKIDEHHFRGVAMTEYIPFEVQKYDNEKGTITVGCDAKYESQLKNILSYYLYKQAKIENQINRKR